MIQMCTFPVPLPEILRLHLQYPLRYIGNRRSLSEVTIAHTPLHRHLLEQRSFWRSECMCTTNGYRRNSIAFIMLDICQPIAT